MEACFLYYALILCDIQACDLWMATHDITMGNDIARDVHCEITMSNDVAMCTYGITMHNDVAMNLFYYVFSALCLIMILLWILGNKNKNKFIFDQSGLENIYYNPTTQYIKTACPQQVTLTC